MIIKLETSASFRATSKILVVVFEQAGIGLKAPSHVTISKWVKKVGVYHLSKREIEKADDWVLIIDESVEFGSEKMLVILGIRQKDIDFTKPLGYQDVNTLVLKVSNSWKGEEISQEIECIREKFGQIKYAVADMGNGIKKALFLSEIQHVEDLTHKFSWFIKQLYEKEDVFINYTKALARLRGSMPLSKIAYILPPAQRVNSRFMNLKPIIDWGNSIILMLQEGQELEVERKKLGFLMQYKEFLKEISQIVGVSIKIQEILKNKGLSQETLDQCRQLFDKQTRYNKLKEFKERAMGYLESNMEFCNKVSCERIICSSDILESSFGKYKNYIHSNPSIGITDLCLTIPAFTLNYKDNDELMKAIQGVKISEIKNWKDKEIGDTLITRRNRILKNEGGRKKTKLSDF